MFSDDDLLPISALQHLLFCPRQCALIHLEQLWAENRLTVEGQQLHRKAHDGPSQSRGRLRTVRGLPLRSYRLGLIGKADIVECEDRVEFEDAVNSEGIVEFKDTVEFQSAEFKPAAALPDARGVERPPPAPLSPSAGRVTPVEYKRGKPKQDDSDRVQLCAQALCLEEMLGVPIASGGIFYGRTRRRTEIAFDAALRDRTIATVDELHRMVASRRTPPARREPKCDNCSLLNLCLPDALRPARTAAKFFDRELQASLAGSGPTSDPFETLEP